jgi:ketosteroid isomerase-like protein
MAERDLEARIRALEDIEAIKKLRARYWRCIREGLWDDFLDCFSDDAMVDLGTGRQLQGKKALNKFYKEIFPTLRSVIIPQGHNPEIDVLSETKAIGKWLIDNPQTEIPSNVSIRLGSTYDEEYEKKSDGWRIKRQRVTHIYKEPIKLESL